MRAETAGIARVFLVLSFIVIFHGFASAGPVKEPNVAGQFYPSDRSQLRRMIASFLDAAAPDQADGPVIGILSPHAGYEFSGPTAAFGYKLIKGKRYNTVVVIASNHRYLCAASLFIPKGCSGHLWGYSGRQEFTGALLSAVPGVVSDLRAFEQEHSLEVQLPFFKPCLKDGNLFL
jgi:AmmeMemoRadiSam system protein B